MLNTNLLRYRKLTLGEITLAQTVYQNSLNYDKIFIHKGRLIPLFQNEKIAMSPFGTMHFRLRCMWTISAQPVSPNNIYLFMKWRTFGNINWA